MAKIKIISNPYVKTISYRKWDEAESCWNLIDYNSNPNSALLHENYTTGFFTLVAARILTTIIDEYMDATGCVELVFEGTSDEYSELQQICQSEQYSTKVQLSKSEVYLENARDILPVINRVFRESISPLVTYSVRDRSKIAKDLDRFSEAANDIVPVCVMGNYSTGKSTFINALIGCEILPTGDVPVTAKIYRIERSEYDDRACIQFEYFDKPAELRFDHDSWQLIPELEDERLNQALNSQLSSPDVCTMIDRVRASLEVLSRFELDTPDIQELADLIRVIVPFGAASCGYAGGDFVVFDTPGSNSASNVNHAEVLQSAMKNMTNGLPVFVTEYDKLDSTDNEALYHQLLNMEELDSSFTTIVVNKADASSLPKKGFTPADREQLLSQAVPKQLYSDGIFFVSSVMGLGAKNNGDFFDEHCAEIFEDQERKYSDPGSRFYKQLYKYNVQPEPLQTYAMEEAAQCKDLVFANSGLYSIEREIHNFAVRFSPYNKSSQASRFLGKVIAVTDEELQHQREEHERAKQIMEEKLESDKLALIRQVEAESNELREAFIAAYPEQMTEPVNQAQTGCDVTTLRTWQDAIVAEQREIQNLDVHEDELKQRRETLGSNLKANFTKALKNRTRSDVRTLYGSFVDDAKSAWEQNAALRETRKEVTQTAADNLIEKAKEEFTLSIRQAQEGLDNASRKIWEDNCQTVKDALLAIISGADVLTEDRRNELSRIIITYDNITFETSADTLFQLEDFRRRFTLKNFIIGSNDVLNIEYLQSTYNENLISAVDEIQLSYRQSHQESFIDWLESLVGTITGNIVSYSPELSKLNDLIELNKREIRDLTSRRSKLTEYTEQIRSMMVWKQ